MEKFIYNNGKLKVLNSLENHALSIDCNYDCVVRGFIFDNRQVYIRINDLSYLQGIRYKRTVKIFKDNLRDCITYFKVARHKIYTSYDYDKLPLKIKDEIKLF